MGRIMPTEEYEQIERLGKYKILAELGRGGMARVFKAEDTDAGQIVAVKALLPELASQPAFVKRFRREIETLRALEHPDIVRILDIGQQAGVQYYVMEYMDGATVEKQLRLRGKFAVPEALKITRSVAEALKYAHAKGFIHRDIKPANIMANAAGDVKLADFGIAKDIEATRLTVTGGIVGTADYMSPEQAEGKRVTRRSDIYSLGVCLYQMLTGRLPFVGKTYLDVIRAHKFTMPEAVRALNPAIPGRVARLVESMMEKDPLRRLSSAGELIVCLDDIESPGTELSDEERESARDMVRWALFPVHDWKRLTLRIVTLAALVVVASLAANGLRYRYFTSAEHKYMLGMGALRRGDYVVAKEYFEEVTYFHPDSPVAKKAEERIREIRFIVRMRELEQTPVKKDTPDAVSLYEEAVAELDRGKRDEGLKLLRMIAADFAGTPGGEKAAAKLKELTGEEVAPPSNGAKPPQSPGAPPAGGARAPESPASLSDSK